MTGEPTPQDFVPPGLLVILGTPGGATLVRGPFAGAGLGADGDCIAWDDAGEPEKGRRVAVRGTSGRWHLYGGDHDDEPGGFEVLMFKAAAGTVPSDQVR